jgi:hypothetical protein
MRRPTKLRTGLLAALAVSLAGSGGLVAVGVGAGGPELPNLQPLLPTTYGTPHSRFMDTIQEPGRTLLRFDTVLMNEGSGRLDLFRTGAGAPTQQKVWQVGETPDDPTQDTVPPPGDISTIAGHDFFYYPAPGHEHFHFPHAAQYQLATLSGTVIADSPKNKVGFCLFDSYGAGAFAQDPCHRGDPGYTGVIRMGISPGVGDLYGAGLTDQWVDVTDVMPGDYQIKATANPDGAIQESDYSDNVKLFPITVAGAAPAATTATTNAGAPVDLALTATVYGADMENRIVPAGSNCATNDADLYTAASECFADNPDGDLATFTVTGASGGAAAIVNPSGHTATLRFVPQAGFSGTATVTYTATDARGLTSPPATATITVTPAGRVSSSPPPGGTGTTATSPAPTPSKSAHFTLSARQLLINQRIGQAAIRRLNAVTAKLDGRPAPAPTTTHKRGTVTLSAAQLLINQRIYQAAIRRAAALEARLDHTPAPTAGSGHGGVVLLTLGQLIINQRIAQAGVRRANALVARVS